ncbi:hypothetical protein PCE1_004783 [Barthelona sp. PCE]
MTIKYACVARQNTVLVDYNADGSDFSRVRASVADKVGNSVNDRRNFGFGAYTIHVVVEQSIIYICVADASSDAESPLRLLNELRKRFSSAYSSQDVAAAAAYSFNTSFGEQLQNLVNRFSGPSVLQKTKEQLNSATASMTSNINTLFERGNKLQRTVDDADVMRNTAIGYDRAANRLKHTMQCARIKSTMFCVLILLVVIYFIVAQFCGYTFSKCF